MITTINVMIAIAIVACIVGLAIVVKEVSFIIADAITERKYR